jgi:plastocyanin
MPCFKLGIRFGRPEIVKRFLQSGRSGFYLAVLEEGRVTAGDSVEWLTRDEHGVTVADFVNLYKEDTSLGCPVFFSSRTLRSSLMTHSFFAEPSAHYRTDFLYGGW